MTQGPRLNVCKLALVTTGHALMTLVSASARRALPLLMLALVSGCSDDGPAPGPSPQPQTTRIIQFGGNLTFPPVQVGTSFSGFLDVTNVGTAPLTVTGLTGSSGITAVLSVSPTTATIQPRASVRFTIRFTPTQAVAYSGTVTFTADVTSGPTSMNFTGTGTLNGIPIFTRSGTGNTVFDMPTYVARVRIRGTYTQFSSNFIIKIGGSLIVNELLGTAWGPTTYDGTHLTQGGVVEITNSSGVAWSIEEVR